MGKSNKNKSKQKQKQEPEPQPNPSDDVDVDDESSVSSEEEGEDLILEGVLIRNQEVESSDDDDDEEEDDDSDGEEEEPRRKKTKVDSTASSSSSSSNKQNKKKNNNTTTNNNNKKNKKPNNKSKSKSSEPEILDVEFTFHDTREEYYHGISNHLLTQPIHAPHASTLSDLVLRNVSVGTIVSTDDAEHNVFGFGSILNFKTYREEPPILSLRKTLLRHCPEERRGEMEVLTSDSTARPVGLFLHGRMVNLPLEITLVLHEQLVLDLDWAVENAEGGEEERKSLDFGAFVLFAGCRLDVVTKNLVYRNFDDEIFVGCAEFVFTLEMGKVYKKKKIDKGGVSDGGNGGEDGQELVSVVVLTKTGHREAMRQMKELIHGT